MKRGCGGALLAGVVWLGLCGLTGCGETETGGEELVILEKSQEQEEADYLLVAVTRDDIQITQEIDCVYQQADEEELCFELSGKKIKSIYVEEGDKVQRGQMLAELDLGNVDKSLAETQYLLERSQILLRQTQEDRDFAIERMEKTNDESTMTAEEKESYAESLADLRQNYEYQIEDYQDSITVLTQKLAELQTEKRQQYIYAGIDGTVAYVKENLEGTSSIAGEKVISVMDIGECTFCSDQIEYADYFEEGQPVELLVSGRSDSCLVVPYKKSEWTEMMQFALCDETENQNLSVGALGSIRLLLEEHTQVLTLPKDAIHRADGKPYVYIISDNNVWETKWITTGLEGKEKVEITGGLSEGDMVILK